MGIKYKLKLKDLKFEYLKEYFIPFLKYFKKTKKIENYSDLKDIILSGSVTAPLLFESPLLILSTNSIPLITLPNTVYCLSKNGAG